MAGPATADVASLTPKTTEGRIKNYRERNFNGLRRLSFRRISK